MLAPCFDLVLFFFLLCQKLCSKKLQKAHVKYVYKFFFVVLGLEWFRLPVLIHNFQLIYNIVLPFDESFAVCV